MTAQLVDRVRRSFSRSFSSYHETANQQAGIADRLIQDLHDSGAPQHFSSALELGCGTGHLTQLLRAEFELGALTLNDLAPEAQQTAEAFNAGFICGDAVEIEWPRHPDLIASSSMIQWLPDPVKLLHRAVSALAPGGWLAVSGFGDGQYRELVRIGSSSGAPGLCSARELAAAVQNDLEVVKIEESVQQARFPSARHVLDYLRKTGVNGRTQKNWTKSRLTQFIDDYTQTYKDQAGLPLTYHAVWIIARKLN
ncbi:methyltransferase domain-containing protein [Ruegeria arenilitoris]|uniref:methyltransferase domain-containing protein n=1 Tax=Ruegeria arenilitoris TaxID=1173585 RepID=UPI00147F7A9D|nr:methyltransferase domain-containing protein [Ruegeria arenilitoris]